MTFQAKLTTKLADYSVDDAIVELKGEVEPEELDQIVKTFLKDLGRYNEKKLDHRNFDFIVGGRILKLNVKEHLKLYSDEIDTNEILSEKLVEVEYVLSLEPPKPLEAVEHDDWVSCLDANESYVISGSYDNSLRIFSVSDRKNLVTIQNAHEKPVTRIKILNQISTSLMPRQSNELYFVSCGHDEVSMLRRFNTKTLKTDVVYIYSGHYRSVNCVDTNDDMIVTGSFDKTLKLWSTSLDDLEEGLGENDPDAGDSVGKNKRQRRKSSEKSVSRATTKKSFMTLTGHQDSVTGVRWLASSNEFNSVASCSMDRTIYIWDMEVGEIKHRIHSTRPFLGIDFCSERNIFITASCDRILRLWDARAQGSGTARTAYTSHTAWVSSVAFGRSSSNHFISGGYDNMVKLWDIRSPKACLYDLIGHHDKVLDVNWSNPLYAMSGSADSTLKVFSTK